MKKLGKTLKGALAGVALFASAGVVSGQSAADRLTALHVVARDVSRSSGTSLTVAASQSGVGGVARKGATELGYAVGSFSPYFDDLSAARPALLRLVMLFFAVSATSF